jgi:hypothetical protein
MELMLADLFILVSYEAWHLIYLLRIHVSQIVGPRGGCGAGFIHMGQSSYSEGLGGKGFASMRLK